MKLSDIDIDHLAQVGLETALAAADFIASQSDQRHATTLKSGVESLATQVVTAIDIKSQEIILDKLEESMSAYDLGLLSEELEDDQSRFTKDYFWCIDPLDGTLPFTEQRHGYALSIALVNKAGESLIGIVADPYYKRHYVAIKGRGCKMNGKAFQIDSINDHNLVCHFDRSFIQSTNYQSTMAQLGQIKEKFALTDLQVITGAGAVMNALDLLDARHGCYIKLPKPTKGGGCIWDFAATSLIFKELGVYVSDSFGNPLGLNKSDSLYMNKEGVLFATDMMLGKELIVLADTIRESL